MLTINACTHSGEAVQKAPHPGTNLSGELLNRAGLPQRCPLWVKSGNAHNEPMMSAFHPKATEQRTQFYVGFVP